MEYARMFNTLRDYWPGAAEASHQVIELSLAEAYRGAKRTIHQDGGPLRLTIASGVHTGSRIYLPRSSPTGTQSVDFCRIVVHDQPPFKRCGDDLHLEFSIDAFTAILGGAVPVPTLFGQATLTVPPGTSPGTTLRLEGLGMAIEGHPQSHGDLCVHLRVIIPESATPLERKLIADNAWLRGWRLPPSEGGESDKPGSQRPSAPASR